MNWININWVELVSSALGLASVWLGTRVSAWSWPLGIVSVLLASWVYFDESLFAEFGLQFFYAFSGVYGWIMWRKKNQSAAFSISTINRIYLAISVLTGFGTGLILGWAFDSYTHADYPYLDAQITSFSIIGQIWLARKYLENWILWMAINIVSIALYLQKGLWFFSSLYFILFILAIKGFGDWKKKMLTSN